MAGLRGVLSCRRRWNGACIGRKNVAGRWNDCGGDKQQSWTAPAWILPVWGCSFDDLGRWGDLDGRVKSSTETEISLRGQEPERAIRLLTVLENAE